MTRHCRLSYRELLERMEHDFRKAKEDGTWPVIRKIYQEQFGVSSPEEFLEKYPDEASYESFCQARADENNPA